MVRSLADRPFQLRRDLVDVVERGGVLALRVRLGLLVLADGGVGVRLRWVADSTIYLVTI